MLRDRQTSAPDPQALALSALGWLLADESRADRLLSLTGLTPEALREGLGDPATLTAVLDFLCAHEPDLVAAADALGVPPGTIVSAREVLAR
jgi:adenine/guanine phosphoribosyltransferase-like PRPP-binding protein